MRWGLALFVVLLCSSAMAHGERKRVAVLTVDGDGADKIRSELVKLLKKSHTVIGINEWNRTAKAASATRHTAAHIKTVSRKLKVDAVVEATSTKRSGGFRVRIRLRSGKTGQTVEDIVATTKGSAFDKASQRDIKDEIVDVISSLEDDEDAKLTRSKKRKER